MPRTSREAAHAGWLAAPDHEDALEWLRSKYGCMWGHGYQGSMGLWRYSYTGHQPIAHFLTADELILAICKDIQKKEKNGQP